MKQAGVSSDAVKAKTGKGWDEWFAVLDKAGAGKMAHKEIAALLSSKHGVADWWSQMVTVGYEQARGLRHVHEKAGGFSAGVSRTLNFPAEAIFTCFTDAKRRKKWTDVEMKITKSTPSKSVRIAAADGTRIDVNIYPKGESKTSVQLQHEKLASADDVARQKEYWAEAFDRLKALLAG